MKLSSLKYVFKVGLTTAISIVIYEILNLFFSYHYFRFEYYLTAAVIIAMITGIVLTRKHYRKGSAVLNDRNVLDDLTAKELRVLELIAASKSNKEIALLNFTEISTVKTHINNIFSKLSVNNRKDAAKIYIQNYNTQKSTFSPPVTI